MGPRPPRRLLSERHRGFDPRPHCIVALSRDSSARTKHSARHPPRFREPGGRPTRQARDATSLRRGCALYWVAHVRGSFSQARSARAPPVADSLWIRLESPSPAIDASTEVRGRSKRFRPANQAFSDRERPSKPTLRAHVRCARAHRPPRLTLRRTVARFQKGEQRRTESRFADSLSRAASLLPARPGDRAAHASQPPESLGFASFGAPRRAAEFYEPRGAFHRLTTYFDQAGLTPCAACGWGSVHSFSPACGQNTTPFSGLV